MTGLHNVYELPPNRRARIGGREVINLESLVTLHNVSPTVVLGFCNWTSAPLGQAIHFIGGVYENQGFPPRAEWVFWAPVRSPSGKDGDVVLVASEEEESRRYQVFYYGDRELRSILFRCVLHAGVGEMHKSIFGRPWPEADRDLRLVICFEVTVPSQILHTLSMKPRTQFD